jgi:hypothetical protein
MLFHQNQIPDLFTFWFGTENDSHYELNPHSELLSAHDHFSPEEKEDQTLVQASHRNHANYLKKILHDYRPPPCR